jgi:hypothetical protein
MPTIHIILLAIAVPVLLGLHTVFIMRSRGYQLRHIDHKNPTKHTGA